MEHDLSGILERDQRTVRVAALDTRTLRLRRARGLGRLVCDQCACVRIPCDTCTSAARTRQSRFPPGFTIRWLVATLCVLALLPRAMAAPTPSASAPAGPSQQPPKWINPCGADRKEPAQELEHDYLIYVTDSDLMQQIVVQAKNALMHAEQFREKYVRHTFKVGFDEHHRNWKNYNYAWLPSIPKQLGERAEDGLLQKQNRDDSLKDIYQYLQQYAVGLEQIVWDQEENRAEFREEFKTMEFKLRSVLCEVQMVMVERSVVPHADVKRDLMTGEFRDMQNNASYRHLRDWIILRDYMNGLEYVIQLFEHFNTRLQVVS